jgi:hypothetical protein
LVRLRRLLLLRDDGIELIVDGGLLRAILEQLLIGGELAGADTLVEHVCIRRGCVLVGGSAGELLLYAGEMMHVQGRGFHYDWGHF